VKSDFGIGSEFIVELPNGIKKAVYSMCAVSCRETP
jgi:hypothetical protein